MAFGSPCNKMNFSFLPSKVRADSNELPARTSVAYFSGPHMQHVFVHWQLSEIGEFVGQPAT